LDNGIDRRSPFDWSKRYEPSSSALESVVMAKLENMATW
jgi:hypothetical protein